MSTQISQMGKETFVEYICCLREEINLQLIKVPAQLYVHTFFLSKVKLVDRYMLINNLKLFGKTLRTDNRKIKTRFYLIALMQTMAS